jgi:hypothetical protein
MKDAIVREVENRIEYGLMKEEANRKLTSNCNSNLLQHNKAMHQRQEAGQSQSIAYQRYNVVPARHYMQSTKLADRWQRKPQQ